MGKKRDSMSTEVATKGVIFGLKKGPYSFELFDTISFFISFFLSFEFLIKVSSGQKERRRGNTNQ